MKFNRGKSVNIVVAVHHMLGVSFTQVTFNQAVIFFFITCILLVYYEMSCYQKKITMIRVPTVNFFVTICWGIKETGCKMALSATSPHFV